MRCVYAAARGPDYDAGSAVNAVFNAWGQVVSYTIAIPSSQNGGGLMTVGRETVQYDALGRPLGEYQSYNFGGVNQTGTSWQTTQHTLVHDANTGEVIQEINQINGQDPVRCVYGPDGNVIVKEAGTGGSTAFNQTLYALQGADGSTTAIANGGGTVVERYAYDGLGIAQALDADGAAYAADSTPVATGTPGQQINEYFVGSTFGTDGSQTADGTQYNWTILYQGENYDALPGVYGTANGAFNPRQQSLLAPDLGAIQQGVSGYDPLAGQTGFQAFLGRHYQAIETGVAVAAGVGAGFATGGLADLAIGAAFGTDLGLWGGAAAGFSAGTVQGLASGESWGQSLEQGETGAVFGGGLAALPWLPALGRSAGAWVDNEATLNAQWIQGMMNGPPGDTPGLALAGGGALAGGAGELSASVPFGGSWSGLPSPLGGTLGMFAAANGPMGSGTFNPFLEGYTPMPGTRTTGVERARRLEAQLVKITGEGTLDWSPQEIEYIRQNGELPDRIIGHHINSAAQFPEWAGDPRNIMFVRGQAANLGEHGGNFQNSTSGPLIDRAAMILLAEGGGE